MFLQKLAALPDALVVDQDVEIVPERFGEFGLIVEQIHDPQIGRERRRISLEHAARNIAPRCQGPKVLEAGMEIRRRGADRLGRHQRMAGGTG